MNNLFRFFQFSLDASDIKEGSHFLDQKQLDELAQELGATVSELPWHQNNPILIMALLFFCLGLFQFTLRTWILSISKNTIEDLEQSFPGQGLHLNPKFGLSLMILGFILFAATYFNL